MHGTRSQESRSTQTVSRNKRAVTGRGRTDQRVRQQRGPSLPKSQGAKVGAYLPRVAVRDLRRLPRLRRSAGAAPRETIRLLLLTPSRETLAVEMGTTRMTRRPISQRQIKAKRRREREEIQIRKNETASRSSSVGPKRAGSARPTRAVVTLTLRLLSSEVNLNLSLLRRTAPRRAPSKTRDTFRLHPDKLDLPFRLLLPSLLPSRWVLLT